MHSRRQTRSPERDPRSKASENRKDTTRWGSILALATIFIVFIYVLLTSDTWYVPKQIQDQKGVGIVDPGDIIRFRTSYGDIRVVLRPDVAPRTV